MKEKNEVRSLTANGYVSAVLRARESAQFTVEKRERELLERVLPDQREQAKALLAKLG